jgi:hypothetical protein
MGINSSKIPLVIKEQLILQYEAGKGAWTYHIIIPGTADIKGKWGALKVTGTIDGYELPEMNLAPRGEQDKIISVNQEIRDSIGKSGGDTVLVTLNLHKNIQTFDKSEILESFEYSDVLKEFNSLDKSSQKQIIKNIQSQKSEDKQIEKINFFISKLSGVK